MEGGTPKAIGGVGKAGPAEMNKIFGMYVILDGGDRSE